MSLCRRMRAYGLLWLAAAVLGVTAPLWALAFVLWLEVRRIRENLVLRAVRTTFPDRGDAPCSDIS